MEKMEKKKVEDMKISLETNVFNRTLFSPLMNAPPHFIQERETNTQECTGINMTV